MNELRGCRQARICVGSDGEVCIYLFGEQGKRISVNLHKDGDWSFAVVDGEHIQVWSSDGENPFDAATMRAAAHAMGIGNTQG